MEYSECRERGTKKKSESPTKKQQRKLVLPIFRTVKSSHFGGFNEDTENRYV